jgi:hypothetical protein
MIQRRWRWLTAEGFGACPVNPYQGVDNISVSGKIILETNVPEIMVSSWAQITIN